MNPQIPVDYTEYTKQSFGKLCDKIYECYFSYYRTIPKELQKKLSIQNCKQKLLENLDKKIALHNSKTKLLAVQCYEKMLESSCKKFMMVSYAEPSCYSLRKENKSFLKNLAE
ncbi:MAG: hypothetical protein H7A23_00760 [Leptospiraceae bacterium]|nr:hypothetical protein [Leptospiraceae bacterium]MCP5493061.1 hypothetical protein [Leptospiraceae bacterium]